MAMALIFSLSVSRQRMPVHRPTSRPSIHSACSPSAWPGVLALTITSTQIHRSRSTGTGGSGSKPLPQYLPSGDRFMSG